MKKITLHKGSLLLLFTFLFTISAYCQLPNFTITAVSNPAACGGTGSIVITQSGASPQATVTYSVYLLPNTTTTIYNGTGNTVPNLGAGNYQIIATQTLGAASNTSPAITIAVQNQVVPITFNAVQTPAICGNDGKITTTVSQGNGPFTYQLFAGSTTVNPIVPTQTSNVFNNLVPGFYTVRVTDSCGAVSNQFIQVTQAPFGILLSSGTPSNGELPSCNSIVINHVYTGASGSNLVFPITFQYTVTNPNGGAPTIVTEVVTTGNPQSNAIAAEIPFYNNQSYTYNLVVTDGCGRIYTRNNNIVNSRFNVVQAQDHANCSDNLLLYTANTFVYPITVSFVNAPAGFNPALANPSYPTFTTGNIIFEGEGLVPDGTYTALFTDACGHTFTTPPMEVEYPEVEVAISAGADCGATVGFMRAVINIAGRTITQVIITDAPDEYDDNNNLPQDVSSFISPIPTTGFLMTGIPLGVYELTITDSCGQVYTETANIAPTGGTLAILPLNRPGCQEGMGSIRLGNPADPSMTSVIINNAPDEFTQMYNATYPYDVSQNIAGNGFFYMNNLPEGDYVIEAVGGDCNSTITQTVTVEGYHVTTNEIQLTQFCGSFNMELQHVSNGTYIQSLWLQKFNEVTGTWGHPFTGVAYAEGSLPSAQNSYFLTPPYINLGYSGQLRVLKVFYTYNNALASNNRCTQVLHTFTVGGGPIVSEVAAFPCSNDTSEAVVVATGVAPLSYRIVTRNGVDFVIDNDESNIFSSLTTGTYLVEVTDDCSNMTPYTFAINTSDPLVIETSGSFCEGETGQLFVQGFSFLTYQWYKETAPGVILSVTNSLEIPSFTTANDAGTYIVSITAPNPDSCMNQLLQIEIDPNDLPNAGQDNVQVLCNDGSVINLAMFLTAPFDAGGTWEDVSATGQLTGSEVATATLAEGSYQFRYLVAGDCDTEDDAFITITLKDIPAPPVATSDVTAVCENGTILLSATDAPGATYLWTGPNNFVSSDQNTVLQNLGTAATGTYSVTVTSANGCTSLPASVAIVVNPLPQFTISGNTTICSGQQTVLSVTPDAGSTATYQWFYNDALMANETGASVTINETGGYRVVVTNNGCENEKSIEVSENTDAFVIDLIGGCKEGKFIIEVVNNEDFAGSRFDWAGPEGYTGAGEEIDISGRSGGDYVVTITNASGCSGKGVYPVDNTSCMIPKGVSPNGDNLNDTFNLSNLEVLEVKIYNRYGLEVWQGNNYTNEWYGQSKGGDLPTGTYYYIVTLPEGKQTGWVYLQREL